MQHGNVGILDERANERAELEAGLALARGCVARYEARLAQLCTAEERAELVDGRLGRSRPLLKRVK